MDLRFRGLGLRALIVQGSYQGHCKIIRKESSDSRGSRVLGLGFRICSLGFGREVWDIEPQSHTRNPKPQTLSPET